jgi:pyruvate oxidase
MSTVSAVLLELLAQAGVKHLFGLPGDALNALVEAERKQDKVRFVHMRHEENAALAAAATAKLTGGLGACMGTAGPGAIHLLNGLYDAKRDHAPVLAVTGQVLTELLGTEAHQEVDLLRLFDDVTVFNHAVVSPDQLPALAEQAIHAALAGHGVAHLNLPLDVAAAAAKRGTLQLTPAPRQIPPAAELQRAADSIAAARHPLILAGVGALKARAELLAFAERIGAPIIKTLPAKELVPDEHPLAIGGLGLLGTRPAVQAVEHCDLLLLIGTDFPYLEFYPKRTPVIQLDRAAEHIGRRHEVKLGLVGDASETLAALLPLVPQRSDRAFLETYQQAMRRWFSELDEIENDDAQPLRPQAVARAVGDLAADDAIFTCDTGAVTFWAARNLRLRGNQRFTLSANLATMGYALPAAIGAQLAYPGRQVVALVGDGGLTMGFGEFLTAVQYDLPLTVVVFNNAKLGLIQMEQEVRGYPEYQTGLHNPDFGAFARLCGGAGWRVEHFAELRPALEAALSSGKPAIVDAVVSGEELTVPPKIDFRRAKGFVKGKARELLGQGDGGKP